MMPYRAIAGVCVFLLLFCPSWLVAEEGVEVPIVVGDWWQIAPNAPDVGRWATGQENACDFAIYRSTDDQWHCVSCIRGTSQYGQRLFYHWTTDKVTNANWTPVGIFECQRGKRQGKPTSVQAPHPLFHHGKYYLFYNSGPAYCLISDDANHWHQHVNTEGDFVFFDMGRDVCVFEDVQHERFIAYYCGTTIIGGQKKGAMVARTAPSPEGPWSATEMAVKTDGNPESPFVVKRGDWYYLWQQMSVYRSQDPLNFNGAELVGHMTGVWYGGKYAPEIFQHDGQWYVSGYSRGLWVAKFQWQTKSPAEVASGAAGGPLTLRKNTANDWNENGSELQRRAKTLRRPANKERLGQGLLTSRTTPRRPRSPRSTRRSCGRNRLPKEPIIYSLNPDLRENVPVLYVVATLLGIHAPYVVPRLLLCMLLLLVPGTLLAQSARATAPAMPQKAELVFSEDWSDGTIDSRKMVYTSQEMGHGK